MFCDLVQRTFVLKSQRCGAVTVFGSDVQVEPPSIPYYTAEDHRQIHRADDLCPVDKNKCPLPFFDNVGICWIERFACAIYLC